MTTFNDETRSRLLIPLEFDQNPTGSTVQLKIDGTWHDTTWVGDPVEEVPGKRWTQTARTIEFFAGPAVDDPAGAIVLPLGEHETETATTFSTGDRVVYAASIVHVTAS